MPEPHLQPGSGVARSVPALAFGCELAMLVGLAVAGADLPEAAWAQVVLAVVLPVVAIGIWGRWMAPTASTRLGDPARLIAQTALFVGTGGLLAAAGHPGWGIAFAVLATAVFAAGRRYEPAADGQ